MTIIRTLDFPKEFTPEEITGFFPLAVFHPWGFDARIVYRFRLRRGDNTILQLLIDLKKPGHTGYHVEVEIGSDEDQEDQEERDYIVLQDCRKIYFIQDDLDRVEALVFEDVHGQHLRVRATGYFQFDEFSF